MDAFETLLATFRAETEEYLERLAQLLEALPGRAGKDLQSAAQEGMRIAHTIKGNAVSTGHQELVRIAHSLEDALSTLTQQTEALPKRHCEALVDTVVAMQALMGPEHLDALSHTLADSTKSPSRSPSPSPSDTDLKVKSHRLDRLMSYASELFVSHAAMAERQTRLKRFQRKLIQSLEEAQVRSETALELKSDLANLVRRDHRDLLDFEQLTQELNQAMKRVRMTPIRALEPFLRKTVRTGARELGKRVELSAEVGDTEIDKVVLDHIREPLLHLLRNCVDHGIELPHARVEAGKPEAGRIHFRAEMVGAMAQLKVSDDGAGIDRTTVEALAHERGRQGPLSDQDLFDVLALPGVSTSATVDQHSGRGVGLDAVRRSVEEVGGRVQLCAATLGGTTIKLSVPTTVVSIVGVLVRAFDEVFAIPIDDVERTLTVDRGAVQSVDGNAAVALTGEAPLQLQWLCQLYGHQPPADSRLLVVVLARGERRVGLVVDEVMGEREFVTKTLPWNLQRVPGIDGATILADGAVALLLDTRALFAAEAFFDDGSARPVAQGRPRILVVDDSLTFRTLQRNCLTSAGYDVSIAVDGVDAWQRLQTEQFDLIVADIQMPRLDGLGLTQRIRGSKALSQLPIVLVSSLGDKEDIVRGAEAGANEYIVKGSFDQTHLLETVSRLI